MEELRHKAGLRVAERIIVFEIALHFNQYYLTCENVVCRVIGIGFNLHFFLGDIVLPTSCLLANLLSQYTY